ncbi:DUF3221 domain-containing protein [Oceanobacillus sp. FSL H7-0719]|uniref:DUF3221 domain-containing protein n=1 Tax=Oceanobacillus sp. FSL H7-0719 TaxID=2954507 RepID=UPI003246379F
MKRALILLFIIVLLVIGTRVLNYLSIDDDLTMDGYIFNKKSATYLIIDDDFNLEEAEQLSSRDLLFNYREIYSLNKSPNIRNGSRVKIWYDYPIAETHPAKLKVLKVEVL